MIKKAFYFILNNKNELIKFFIVGILSTIINYLTYYFLYRLTKLIILASLSGFLIGLLNSYLLSRYWTFSIKKYNQKNLIFRFLMIHLSGMMAGIFLIYFVDQITNNFIIAWIIGALFVAPYNYIGLKKFTFK